MRNYMSADNYVQCVGESNCGEVKIDKISYVSPKRQIEALFYAGGQFLPPKESEYDFETLEECDKDNGSSSVRDADIIDIVKLSECVTYKGSDVGGASDDNGPSDGRTTTSGSSVVESASTEA